MASAFELILNNKTLISAVTAWAAAQLMKFLIYWGINKKILWNRLIGSGGMPSSHSSTVSALVVSAAKCYGIGSFEFTIAFLLAIIVIHDARGVRLEAGKQAKVLNKLISSFSNGENNILEDVEFLKELIGHTPFQVTIGIIIGLVIGFLIG